MQWRMYRAELEPKAHWMNRSWREVAFAGVNALSEYLEVENYHDGALWRQKYQHGLPVTQLVGIRDARSQNRQGTQFIFRPDFSIFEKNNFDITIVERYAREIAVLFPGFIAEVRDTRVTPAYESVFQYAEGAKTRIEQINSGNQSFHEVVHICQKCTVPLRERHSTEIEVEIAFQFSDGPDSHLNSYINGGNIEDVGYEGAYSTLPLALKYALLSCVNEYIDTTEGVEGFSHFRWDDLSPGFAAIVSMYCGNLHVHYRKNKKVVTDDDFFGQIAGMVFRAFSREEQAIARIVGHRGFQQAP